MGNKLRGKKKIRRFWYSAESNNMCPMSWPYSSAVMHEILRGPEPIDLYRPSVRVSTPRFVIWSLSNSEHYHHSSGVKWSMVDLDGGITWEGTPPRITRPHKLVTIAGLPFLFCHVASSDYRMVLCQGHSYRQVICGLCISEYPYIRCSVSLGVKGYIILVMPLRVSYIPCQILIYPFIYASFILSFILFLSSSSLFAFHLSSFLSLSLLLSS